MKKSDILAVYIANIIHDYEHSGFSNQFIVRTKHPIAIRYSDSCVMENHHLASAFNVMLKSEKNNIMHNLPLDMFKEMRHLIIEIVLNTDMSKHFGLMTTLKTKLGAEKLLEEFEDRVLVYSCMLRTCDIFKVVRDERKVFNKWMDRMFEEFYKQGDVEKDLGLPMSKFMDKENTNKDKAYLNYIQLVCRPLLTTFLIVVQDEEINIAVLKEGVDKNKKSLD